MEGIPHSNLTAKKAMETGWKRTIQVWKEPKYIKPAVVQEGEDI